MSALTVRKATCWIRVYVVSEWDNFINHVRTHPVSPKVLLCFSLSDCVSLCLLHGGSHVFSSWNKMLVHKH